MKTQKQMFYDSHRKVAERNNALMELISHPTNPLTNKDLEALIKRWPERYGIYSGLVGTLPN